MLSILILILGIAVVVSTLLDILYTVLAPSGSGLVTGKLTHWMWRLVLNISGFKGEGKFLSNVGVFILMFIVIIWVLLLWVGNAMIVYSDPYALYNSTETAYQTDFVSKLYFSGYVLSAMGHGDYSPVSDFWKTYTALGSFTGVIFISLAISYLIPVIEAVSSKRLFSLKIDAMGKSPENILAKHWQSDDFEFLIEQLNELQSSIFQLSQQHLAYPVIHYFHSNNRYESSAIGMARIDETITILYAILSQQGKFHQMDKLDGIRKSITYFLSTLKGGYINPCRDMPVVPDCSGLDKRNFFTSIDYQLIRDYCEKETKRRKMLLAYVQNDAWKWDDVVNDQSVIEI